MKPVIIILLSVTWYFSTTFPAYSQDTYGHLAGRLYDSNEIPVQGATIVVSGPDLQGLKTTLSDKNGYFKITSLPVGEYRLKIDHVSFHDVIIESVIIKLGSTTNIGEQTLQLRNVVLDEVVVKWTEPIINTSSYSIEENLKPEFFEALPTGRDYLSVITLLPRVNESFLGDEPNISGASGSDNIYFIDGDRKSGV